MHFIRLWRVLAVALIAVALSAPAAEAHDGNPNFRSVLNQVSPSVPGLHVQVLGYDAYFELVNQTGKPIVVYGYSNEPYARLLPDGTVEVNKQSPAYYLNQDRFATTPVPAGVTGNGTPQWQVQNKSGRFVWHDHRMHWMSTVVPPQVHDKSRKTKIFNYGIPLSAGGNPVKLDGTLFWVGQPSGFPAIAVISLVLLALVGLAFVLAVRRRRGAAPAAKVPDSTAEAW